MKPTRIVTLGTQVVLPAFVVGFEVHDGHEVPDDLDVPPWVLWLEQQAGGASKLQFDLVGAVLRLEANLDRSTASTPYLSRGLKAAGESPNHVVLREYPQLKWIAPTRGDAYDQAALEQLHGFVTQGVLCPPFETGMEALLRCVPADPLRYFRGFQALVAWPRAGAPVPAAAPPALSDLELRDDLIFDEAAVEALMDVGRQLHQPPRIHFLWENSH
jgi:hypothetical protein